MIAGDTIDDAVQDAFCSMAALPERSRLAHPEAICHWLTMVAQRRLNRCHRLRTKFEPGAGLPPHDHGSTALMSPAGIEAVLETECLLSVLSDRERLLLNLNVAGYSIREISERAGEPYARTHKRLSRARGKLRRAGGENDSVRRWDV